MGQTLIQHPITMIMRGGGTSGLSNKILKKKCLSVFRSNYPWVQCMERLIDSLSSYVDLCCPRRAADGKWRHKSSRTSSKGLKIALKMDFHWKFVHGNTFVDWNNIEKGTERPYWLFIFLEKKKSLFTFWRKNKLGFSSWRKKKLDSISEEMKNGPPLGPPHYGYAVRSKLFPQKLYSPLPDQMVRP